MWETCRIPYSEILEETRKNMIPLLWNIAPYTFVVHFALFLVPLVSALFKLHKLASTLISRTISSYLFAHYKQEATLCRYYILPERKTMISREIKARDRPKVRDSKYIFHQLFSIYCSFIQSSGLLVSLYWWHVNSEQWYPFWWLERIVELVSVWSVISLRKIKYPLWLLLREILRTHQWVRFRYGLHMNSFFDRFVSSGSQSDQKRQASSSATRGVIGGINCESGSRGKQWTSFDCESETDRHNWFT